MGRCLYSDVHWSTIHNNEGIKQPKCPLMSNGTQRAYTHVHAKSLQLCPALCDPMDCSPPGSSVHGTLQAGILEWVAISSSRGNAKSLQLCPALCDPMAYSPPSSSVHGSLQARIPEWVAMPSSRGSYQPRDQTCISCLPHWQVGSLPLVPPE